MKFRLRFLTIAVLIFFTSSINYSQIIKDLIQPIRLKTGKPDSVLVSDLFYSKNYDVHFIFNPFLTVKYDSGKNFLKLKPVKDFEGMTLLGFVLKNEEYQIPIIVKREHYYTFKFKPQKKYKELTLFGSFNGWNRHQLYMKDENNDGIFEVKVPLEPGTYQYKFWGDGKEIVDPANPEKVPNGFGDFNSVITIKNLDSNKIYLHQLGYTLNRDSSKYRFVLESNLHAKLRSSQIIALINNKIVRYKNILTKKNEIEICLPNNRLKDKNIIRVAVNINGRVSNIQSVFLVNGKPAKNNYDWHSAIIYSLMIDRFYDGDPSINHPVINDSLSPKANFMGGDLQGVINKIDGGYFDTLGVNVIWISPVYDNPDKAFKEYPKPHRWFSGYHGYWPISSTRVEENFGTIEKVKELVSKAHNHRIKVLLDFVSHHVHKDHPFYKQHRDWFGNLRLPDGRLNIRFWDEYRLTTWFEPYLPSFNYLGSQTALDTMTSNAIWWLKTTGADGFRHDAVKHVPNKFWRLLTKKIKREIESKTGKNIYQIGETFGSYDLIKSYVNNGQLNAQFNFNLYDIALPTFIKPELSFSGLDKEIHKSFEIYGFHNLMGNIMDSHDKNRFMAFADGDLDVSQWSAIEEGWNNPPKVDHPESYKKLILYMAYMNTIPGIPVIYYGSEFGMTGASDPDNRRMMRFGNQLSQYEKNTLKSVAKIVHLRREHSALNYGDFYTLSAGSSVYAFLRSDMNERLLIVLNKSNSVKKADLILPAFLDVDLATDLVNKQKIPTDRNSISIVLPAMSYRILKLSD